MLPQPQFEHLPGYESDASTSRLQRAMAETAINATRRISEGQLEGVERFTLEDLSIRIAGDLVLGVEAQKIKNCLETDRAKFISNQQIDDFLRQNQLVDQAKAREEADFAVDEVVLDDETVIYLIDDFYNFRKQIAQQHRQFKQAFTNPADYQQALKDLPMKSSPEKRRQLKQCLIGKLVEFNRQIQELLRRPTELPTLESAWQFIDEAVLLTHFPEKRDKNGQLVFLNAKNTEFRRAMIETALIGAINERCFAQLFELTDLGKAIEYHPSTVAEDQRGIDCKLLVKYRRDDGNRYRLARVNQVARGDYQQCWVPIDIKASRRLADDTLNKRLDYAQKHHTVMTSWPMFSGIHREDLALYRTPSGEIDMLPVYAMKTSLDADQIRMMNQLSNVIYYGRGYRPDDFISRLDQVKADILRGVEYFDHQADTAI